MTPHTNFSIKKYSPVEIAPVVYDIVKHSFTRYFDHIPETLDKVIEYIKDSDVYMVYDGIIPVGYFVLRQKLPKEYELLSMAVSGEHQGKGIGTFMMEKVNLICQGATISLVTHPKNVTALIIYLKNGFVIDGWLNNYLGDGQPRLSLTKKS